MYESLLVFPMITFLLFGASGIIFLFVIINALIPRRSDSYRADLVNMYVAARIRQLAAEDKLDLDAEYNSFKKWVKKMNMENKSLNSAIEAELKERISLEKEKPDQNKK